METELISSLYIPINYDLPKGWRKVKIRDIAKVTSGGTPDRSKEEFWNGTIPWITTSLIALGIITTAEEYITEKGLSSSATKLFPIGTLLMAMYGQGQTRGKVAMLGLKAATNQACAAILLTDKSVDNRYLYYNLQNRYSEIRNLSNTGNQENLNGELIKLLSLKLPSPSEQRKIADILSTWDGAIQVAQRLLEAKKQRKRGLMQQLLTGQKRLPGFSGEWREWKTGEIFRNTSIKNHPNEELLSATQDRGVIPRSMLDGRVAMPESETKSYKLVKRGNFLISLRSFQGGIEHSEYQGIVSTAYTVLTPRITIDEYFYRHYFKSGRFIRKLGVAIIGIRDGKQISYVDFSVIKIPQPELEEQHAISTVLNAADDEIRLATAEVQALQRQKRGIMHLLLTGEKLVTVDE